MKKLSALIPALVIAPWVVVPVIVIGGLWSSDAGPASDFASGLVVGVLAVPAAYVGAFVVGVPAYLLLERLGLLRAWSLSLVGGAVPLLLSWDSGRPTMQLLLCAAGAAVALTAWQLVPRSHVQESAHEP